MVCYTPYLQNEFGDPRFFFYVFSLILSFSTCIQSFEKICTWELLGANAIKISPKVRHNIFFLSFTKTEKRVPLNRFCNQSYKEHEHDCGVWSPRLADTLWPYSDRANGLFQWDIFFDRWGIGWRGKGFWGQYLVTLEVFNLLLTMSLGDFIRHPKLFSLRSLSWSGYAILDFTTILQNAKNSRKFPHNIILSFIWT